MPSRITLPPAELQPLRHRWVRSRSTSMTRSGIGQPGHVGPWWGRTCRHRCCGGCGWAWVSVSYLAAFARGRRPSRAPGRIGGCGPGTDWRGGASQPGKSTGHPHRKIIGSDAAMFRRVRGQARTRGFDTAGSPSTWPWQIRQARIRRNPILRALSCKMARGPACARNAQAHALPDRQNITSCQFRHWRPR